MIEKKITVKNNSTCTTCVEKSRFSNCCSWLVRASSAPKFLFEKNIPQFNPYFDTFSISSEKNKGWKKQNDGK
jgi:hypothetical protein